MFFSDKFVKANDEVCDFDNPVPAPYFRKTFEIDENVKSAEITVCGLGFYELYLNGKEITKGFLAPYISNPDDIYYYDNYDISDKLINGKNCIGIVLGNGFRNSFGGFVWNFEQAQCRGPLMFSMSLEVTDTKENKLCLFEADSDFKTFPSPIILNDLRMGCWYDARREIPNWNSVDFDDTDWSNAKPCEKPRGIAKLCNADPIKLSKKIKAVDIKHFDSLPFAYESTAQNAKPIASTIRKNVFVYDFGINTAGVTALKINGKAGQKITIRHGEHLIRGCFDQGTTIFFNKEFVDRYLEYSQKDVYICKGGEEYFVPKFKYDGFRYAYVEGLEKDQATKDALICLEMHSDVKRRADFSCSCDTLNKLYKATLQSDMANLFYFPTDCPHREKNGWTGDANMSAEQFMLNFNAENCYREWLHNIKAAQNSEGALPGIVPTGGWGFEWGNGPAWDAICVTAPYYIYKYTGNKEPIFENSEMILRYLKYIMSRRNEIGLIAVGLGDWVDPYQAENGKISAPLEVTDSITVYDMAVKAEKLFDVINDNKSRKYAIDVQVALRKAIRDNLIDFSTMTVLGNCQTSQALALECGIFDQAELKSARLKLVETIKKNNNENACGMIGSRYIFHALTKAGYADLAYDMIVSENRTGFGSWIKSRETTLCESFIEASGVVVSRNHHFFGNISSWMIQDICGLKPNPNLNDIAYVEISPNFISALSYAYATFKTPFGELNASWERKDNTVMIKTQIPKGIRSELKLKDQESISLKQGENVFIIE